MMYPYMTLADETEITHSHILERNGRREIEVHFERPTDDGFDVARCILPIYDWVKLEGFTQSEILVFQQIIQNHAHLFYRYAEGGGVNIA